MNNIIKLSTVLLLTVFIFGCKSKRHKNEIEYKYKIVGTVPLNSGGRHDAVWITDTFTVDTFNLNLKILNSDGSEYLIEPPYVIYRINE